jgi:uncharacterized HAD superfamily protein
MAKATKVLIVPNFCIDIDNVIARTDEVMRHVIAEYTKNLVQLEYEDIQQFNYFDCKDKAGNSIRKDEWPHVHDLFSESRYLWLVQPFSGALEGLRRLAQKGTLHFATARLPKARRVTVEWLESHNFPPHDLHFLRQGEKHASLRPFSAAVEDHYEQATGFSGEGETPCFLIRHPWNRERPAVEGVEWVDTWPELTERLLALSPAP